MRPAPSGDSQGAVQEAPAPLGRRTLWLCALWQVCLIALFFLVYFGVRGLTTGAEADADRNAQTLIDIERDFGGPWEASLQGAIIDEGWVVTLANWVYIWGHLPLLAGTAIWLFRTRGDRFLVMRNAIFLSGLVGLIIFWRFPVAPPRFGLLEVVDTVSENSSSYRAVQPPLLTNQFAAFPSLHFGWNLTLGIVMWGTVRNVGGRIAWAFSPVAMAGAVVLTGNHYVIDVVGGGVLALAGLAVAAYLHRRPLVPIPRMIPPGAGRGW